MNDCECRLWRMLHSRDEGLLQLKKSYATLDQRLTEQREATEHIITELNSTQQELRLKVKQLQQERKSLHQKNRAHPERVTLKYVDMRLDQMRRALPFFWILRPKAWMFRSLKHHLLRHKEQLPNATQVSEHDGSSS